VSVVEIILRIVHVVLIVFLTLLWARIVIELVRAINRDWRPRGAVLFLAEAVLTTTDPPVKLVRRLVPPLRLGPVAIDLGLLLVMLATILLMSAVATGIALA